MISSILFISVIITAGFFYYIAKNKFISIIILLFAYTDGFFFLPPNLTSQISLGPINKLEDAVLVLIFLDLFLNLQLNVKILKKEPVAKIILIFELFIVINILYSYFVKNYELVYIIRASRKFFYFFAYFIFYKINKKNWLKFFDFLKILIFIQSAITIFQFFSGYEIFQSVRIQETTISGVEWKRLYFRPILTDFFYFYYLLQYLKNRKNSDLLFFLTLAFITVLTGSRGGIIALLIVSFLVVLFLKNIIIKFRTLLYVISLVIILNSFGGIYIDRLQTGITDLVSGVEDMNSKFAGNNFSFRIALFMERLNYIWDTGSYVFGIGFTTEDSPMAKYLNFRVGLRNDYGSVIQMDTGDIVWAIFILKLGFIGTLLFIYVLLKIYKMTFQGRNNLYIFAMFGYLSMLLILSINGTNLMSDIFIYMMAFIMSFKLKTTGKLYRENIHSYTLIQSGQIYRKKYPVRLKPGL